MRCDAGLLQKLVGPWRLVFSGPSKIQALSYIPVDEDLIIDAAASTLKLESDLGPLRAKFRGRFKWRPADAEMDFAFNEAEVRDAPPTALRHTDVAAWI